MAAVSRAVPAEPGGTDCQLDPAPAWAYIALERRAPAFPDHDLGLFWTEKHGWAAVLETAQPDGPVVLAYIGGELLIPPAEVATFIEQVLRGEPCGQYEPPAFDRRDGRSHLEKGLFAYAGDD